MTLSEKSSVYFSESLYRFLRELKKNNNREWFARNKARYEELYVRPSVRFIKDAGRQLRSVSSYLVGDPKPFGGSLFRIYRDIRFSKDKSPYKTNLAIEFWHKKGSGYSSPGLYLHIQPGENFLGGGVWHPDSTELKKIRTAIVDRPDAWRTVLASKPHLEGESLKRPPAGFPLNHRFVGDLKRKDFITSVSFTDKQIVAPLFLTSFIEAAKRMNPLNKFLAEAIGLRW